MYNSYALNYFPYSAQNLFDGTHAPGAVKTDSVAYAFWCRALFQRLVSVIEFKLPESWERASDFFEACLFGRGFVGIFNTREFGTVFNPGTVSGQDFYYMPTKFLVANPAFNGEFTIGKNCQLIKLTNDFCGVVDIVSYYAEKLATLDGAINMSIINSKFAYILGAKNKAASQALKMIFDKINKGEPLVVYDYKQLSEGLGDSEPFEFLDRQGLKNSYITDDLLNSHQTILNQFDSEIGIPTLPAEKRERMITDEANARKADSSARISLWNECLTRSCKEVNDMFGLNISFKFKYLNDNLQDDDENLGEMEAIKKWVLQSQQ